MAEAENREDQSPTGGTPATSEKPLFLAPKARAGDGHGYVSKPYMGMRDEPECVGPAILEDWEQVNRLHRSQKHQLEVAAMQLVRPMLKLDDRVRDIQRRAKQSGFDMKRETALMRRDIERAKAGGRKPPVRTLQRCEGLEALLDGVALADAA